MNAPQRSPEWFQARRHLSVTGSMVGMILGDSPYGDYQTALRNKVRECLGLPPDRPMNEAMRKGVEMESVAREAYEVETGNLVSECGIAVHPNYEWIGSSPDGDVADRDLEIKIRNTPKPIADRPWEWAQCQLHMHCTGKKFCDYWQWNESGGVLETVERDDSWLEENLPLLREFHEELRGILADEELQKPYREPLIEQRDDPQWSEAASAYLEVKAVLEAAQDAEKKARSVILTLADNKACEGAGIKVTTYEKQGLINNKKLHEACRAANIDPENFRGKPTTQTRITTK